MANAADTSGVITIEPPKQGDALYGVLVHWVNEDGNHIGVFADYILKFRSTPTPDGTSEVFIREAVSEGRTKS